MAGDAFPDRATAGHAPVTEAGTVAGGDDGGMVGSSSAAFTSAAAWRITRRSARWVASATPFENRGRSWAHPRAPAHPPSVAARAGFLEYRSITASPNARRAASRLCGRQSTRRFSILDGPPRARGTT
jgi:hypothetical protein